MTISSRKAVYDIEKPERIALHPVEGKGGHTGDRTLLKLSFVLYVASPFLSVVWSSPFPTHSSGDPHPDFRTQPQLYCGM